MSAGLKTRGFGSRLTTYPPLPSCLGERLPSIKRVISSYASRAMARNVSKLEINTHHLGVANDQHERLRVSTVRSVPLLALFALSDRHSSLRTP